MRARLACANMGCTKHCHLGAIWSSPRRESCGSPLHEAWEGPGGLLPGWRGTGEGHRVPLWLCPAKDRHVSMLVETQEAARKISVGNFRLPDAKL